jgi:hypothetical protein
MENIRKVVLRVDEQTGWKYIKTVDEVARRLFLVAEEKPPLKEKSSGHENKKQKPWREWGLVARTRAESIHSDIVGTDTEFNIYLMNFIGGILGVALAIFLLYTFHYRTFHGAGEHVADMLFSPVFMLVYAISFPFLFAWLFVWFATQIQMTLEQPGRLLEPVFGLLSDLKEWGKSKYYGVRGLYYRDIRRDYLRRLKELRPYVRNEEIYRKLKNEINKRFKVPDYEVIEKRGIIGLPWGKEGDWREKKIKRFIEELWDYDIPILEIAGIKEDPIRDLIQRRKEARSKR